MKFLAAEWRKLIVANYLVEPELLKPFLPYGTELDYWNGKLHLSLVGFMFLNTRVLGLPIPFHINFEEVNLRFYVKYKHENEWRRGVVFVKEIVPRTMITFVANTLYGEHYETLPMNHIIAEKNNTLHVEYHIKKNNHWHKIKADASNKIQPMVAGSEAEFITEHYWGYTKINDGKTSQYEVKHPKWDFYDVTNFELEGDFTEIYGKQFAFVNQKPDTVFLAEGSEIAVMKNAAIRK